MEAALISSVVALVVAKLNKTMEDGNKLRSDLKKDLDYIKKEMEMMNKVIIKFRHSKDHREWVLQVQELAYSIEDSIDIFQEKLACEAGTPWYIRKLHQLKTVNIRTQFAQDLKDHRVLVVEAYNRIKNYLGLAAAPSTSASAMEQPAQLPETDPLGIEEPKNELLELLGEAEPSTRRVICILGPRGMGKTTLAWAAYDDAAVRRRFHCRAWVVASEHRGATELLKVILSQVKAGVTTTDEHVGENLRRHLQANKRYLIVIDDMQTSLLDAIGSYFPEKDTYGRIIVTTSMQSIANKCSAIGGYVHRMRALNEDDSKALLRKKVFGSVIHSPSPDFDSGSESILKKCDGLPLGIVNIANYLIVQGSERITRDSCKDLCTNLGSCMQSNPALARMKQMLIHSYENLPSDDMKTCLLSVSIYPKDRPIKRKSLIRKWLAEGFVVSDFTRKDEDVASEHFEELINRSIIQPVDISNNAGVKTCRLHGIMLDLIVHKSATENFITLIHNDEVIPKSNTNSYRVVRRLSLHKPNDEGGKAVMKIEKSRIRSLAIFEHVFGQALVNFSEYKLLRVLDLENCKELKESHIDGICKLLQLKYLSLRGTDVSKLPKKISKLHHLETLDIRGTGVNILPKEVLNLPQLIHLFGKFKLPRELGRFSGGSELQTLAGFVMDEDRSFQQIMLKMKKLRKVKIWSESTPSAEKTKHLVSSLKDHFIGANPLKALSLDFGDHSINFLDNFDDRCALTSLKLQGRLGILPNFDKLLHNLSELHLLSTGLNSEALSTLQNLRLLIYLKLVEHHGEIGQGSFSVQTGGFPSLQRLCIKAGKLPQMSIARGAMRHLYSLQLLSADISGLDVGTIKYLEGLKDLTFATSVDEDKKESWEAAVKKHKNRPIIIQKEIN